MLKLASFIRADLLHLPIKDEAVDLVISTRTISDVESFPCRATRAIAEFYRALKNEGKIVLSDECPAPLPTSSEEEVAVHRWQLAKAISHMVGRSHANEIFPIDLEYVVRLVGFRHCQRAVFKGEKIPQRRINHFVTKSTEMCTKITNSTLKNAFMVAI